MFRPLFETVRETIIREELIPTAGGGYRAAGDLRLAGGTGLAGLLDAAQLGTLYGTGAPAWFAEESISETGTPVLWRFLRDEAGLAEVTAEGVVTRLSVEFLKAQPDEWIAGLYAFLYLHSALWPAARAKPVIRLEDGGQVAPFDAGGRPAVYLPGPARSSLPTVRRAVAASPAARPFLDALELAEPDVAPRCSRSSCRGTTGWRSRRWTWPSTTPTWTWS